MKFITGKLPAGEYKIGQEVNLSDIEELSYPDDHPMSPHEFVIHTGKGCAICGMPESAIRHRWGRE